MPDVVAHAWAFRGTCIFLPVVRPILEQPGSWALASPLLADTYVPRLDA